MTDGQELLDSLKEKKDAQDQKVQEATANVREKRVLCLKQRRGQNVEGEPCVDYQQARVDAMKATSGTATASYYTQTNVSSNQVKIVS